jgi:hypothetical protein
MGLLLRFDGANLWLVGAVVGMHRTRLRLSWTRLLGLNRANLGFSGADWLHLRTVVWLGGSIARLDRTSLWLAGSDGLYGWAVVWLAGTDSRLNCWLSGAAWHHSGICSGIGPRKAGLRGNRPGSGDHGRAAPVHVVELLTILGGFALVLDLGRHRRSSWAAHALNLRGPRSHRNAASASVIGDAGVVVDDDSAVVDVGDVAANAVDGTVVVEVVAVPVAAVVAVAGVAEAVVNAAIEADVEAPIAAMEAPAVAVPAPVAGGPEGAVVRGRAPVAGDPVVAGRTPVPIARDPDVVRRGNLGLLVDREGRGWLVGVLDGLGLAFGVEFVKGLSVLVGLILIGRRRGSGLLRRVLGSVGRGNLLGLGLGADSEHCALRGWLELVVVDGRHVGVGGVWP